MWPCRCKDCDGAATQWQPTWELTHEAAEWERRLGWPPDGRWTESNWPPEQPYLQLYQVPAPRCREFATGCACRSDSTSEAHPSFCRRCDWMWLHSAMFIGGRLLRLSAVGCYGFSDTTDGSCLSQGRPGACGRARQRRARSSAYLDICDTSMCAVQAEQPGWDTKILVVGIATAAASWAIATAVQSWMSGPGRPAAIDG